LPTISSTAADATFTVCVNPTPGADDRAEHFTGRLPAAEVCMVAH
jgi:hypothetical protein